jgi:hypothetical protein
MDKAEYLANLYKSVALHMEIKMQCEKRGDTDCVIWHGGIIDKLQQEIFTIMAE